MNTKYIISLTALVALTGALSYGAASNPNPEMPIGSLALLYAESSADQAPRILASLYRKNLLQLALIGYKEPQRFPNLYQDARRELFRQKEKFQQLLQQHNGDLPAALLDAAQNNKPWTIDYLVQNRANVNARIHYGQTALMWAARTGHGAVVAQLLANGANVNAKNNQRRTALMRAAEYGDGAIIAQLLANGANVNEKNSDGMTALILALMNNREAEAIATQLRAAGADVNAKNNNGETVLIYATRSGNAAVVAQLIAAGADIDARDNRGNTALSLAESIVKDAIHSQDRRDRARAIVDLLTRGRSPLKTT